MLLAIRILLAISVLTAIYLAFRSLVRSGKADEVFDLEPEAKPDFTTEQFNQRVKELEEQLAERKAQLCKEKERIEKELQS